MISCDKSNPSGPAVRFEIDDHGVLVPMLRHGKAASLRTGLQVKKVEVRLKQPSRLQ
jgi:hypothetical protein